LKLKYDAMVEACDELDRLTKGVKEGGEGKWSRDVYLAATEKSNPYKAERVTGRSITPLSRFKEGRLDGLIPREAWVPAESRGKAWNYDWKRPTD
jgi:large subunit ribosomal protein L40